MLFHNTFLEVFLKVHFHLFAGSLNGNLCNISIGHEIYMLFERGFLCWIPFQFLFCLCRVIPIGSPHQSDGRSRVIPQLLPCRWPCQCPSRFHPHPQIPVRFRHVGTRTDRTHVQNVRESIIYIPHSPSRNPSHEAMRGC